MRGGRYRGRRLRKAWLTTWALLAALHVVFCAAIFLIVETRPTSPRPALIAAGIFIVALGATMAFGFRLLSRANLPLEDREARAAGRDATAKVLSVEQTKWRLKRTLNFRLQVTPTRWEYRMHVRVTVPGEEPFEAEMLEYLLSDDVPKRGDVLRVRVHPRLPDVLAWMDVPPTPGVVR